MQQKAGDLLRSNSASGRRCRSLGWGMVIVCSLVWTVEPAAGQAQPNPLPPLDQVETAVREYFAVIPDREETDIVSQGDMDGVFTKLEKLGWSLSAGDRKSLLDRVLADNDDLVRLLRTKAGTKFMRECARYPQAYDRLDRLRRMPYGMRRIRGLITTPDGYKLIQYMTVSPYGRNFGKQISQGKNGKNFNQPTDRFYTPDDVLDQFVKSYRAEVVRRAQQVQPPAAAPGKP